jgi:hypothetical protein
MNKRLLFVSSWLLIFSLLFTACGGAPDPAPQPIATAAVLVQPDGASQINSGNRWRGSTLKPTDDPAWFCWVNCYSGREETWVSNRNGSVVFGRTVGADVAESMAARTRIGVQTAGFDPALVTIQQIGKETLVVSPDLGMSWDLYWQTHTWDDDVARAMLQDVIDNYIPQAAKNGLIWTDDVGSHQLVVTNSGRTVMIDFETTQLVESGSFGPFKSLEKYRAYYTRLLENDLTYDASNYGGGAYFATPAVSALVEPAQPVSGAPAAGEIDVLVVSKINGEPTIVRLTTEQVAWLKAGDSRIVPILSEQGVVMPKVGAWAKVGRFGLTVLEFIGTVALIYTVSDTLIDVSGMGDTTQTSTFYADVVVEPGAYTTSNELVAHSYENTVLYQVTQERTPDQVVSQVSSTGKQCYKVRLDDSSVINVSQLFGINVDNDIPTPIQICGGTGTQDWAVFMNLETGENFEYTKNPDGTWTGEAGCTSFSSLVSNQAATEFVDAEFDFCSDGKGLVTYTPTWAGQP